MLSLFGRPTKLCDGITRREVLRVGALAVGGLAMADVLKLRAASGTESQKRNKSVIMVWLRGGPSHIDSYDMKPDAPPEIRGEFRPTATNVPGIQICDLMPRQAKMMDKLAIIRGIKSNDLGDHTPHYIITGSPDRGKRPAFGSVVSYLRPQRDGMPPYVSLMYDPPKLYDNEGPVYVGHAHRPFVPREEGIENLSLARGIETSRLDNRRSLLTQLDTIRREVESRSFAGIDEHTVRALQMIASPRVREAFDLKREGDAQRERYGKYSENLLMARRLVEAGVSVVTLKLGDYDTHEKNFIDLRDQLPKLDQGIAALVDDLYDRGLEKDVAVVVWGEFGRAPPHQPRRRPRPLAGSRRCAPCRRRIPNRPGHRRNRPSRRPQQGSAVHPGQHPGHPLPPPRHRLGDHHPRLQQTAHAPAGRPGSSSRTDISGDKQVMGVILGIPIADAEVKAGKEPRIFTKSQPGIPSLRPHGSFASKLESMSSRCD